MASIEGLPVYRDVFRLTNMVMDEAGNIPKELRFTLTDRMLNAALDMLRALNFAYCTKGHQRLAHIDAFRALFGTLKSLLRIAAERKLISLGKSAQFFELIGEISKQMDGWRKATANSSVPELVG